MRTKLSRLFSMVLVVAFMFTLLPANFVMAADEYTFTITSDKKAVEKDDTVMLTVTLDAPTKTIAGLRMVQTIIEYDTTAMIIDTEAVDGNDVPYCLDAVWYNDVYENENGLGQITSVDWGSPKANQVAVLFLGTKKKEFIPLDCTDTSAVAAKVIFTAAKDIDDVSAVFTLSETGTKLKDYDDKAISGGKVQLKAQFDAAALKAGAVDTKITALTPAKYTAAYVTAIADAKTAYEGLTSFEKEFVTKYADIATAEAAYKVLKDNVDSFIALANAIDSVSPKQADVDAADEAYAKLTDDGQKTDANVIAAKKKLDDAKVILGNSAKDKEEAEKVDLKIDAIGTVEFTPASKELIDAARTAYEALTTAQKELVTKLATLTAAETKYQELKSAAEKADKDAASDVDAKIALIGEVKYSSASKALIDDARAAYNALNETRKALVTKLTDLESAEDAYEALAAGVSNFVKDVRDIGDVELSKEEAITFLVGVYEDFTAEQKADADVISAKAVLDAAVSRIADIKKINAAIEKIEAIGVVEFNSASKELIDAARAAYDALGQTLQAEVKADTLKILTDAETAYANLEKADAVAKKIEAIGEVTFPDSLAAITAARSAYDALDAVQKELVGNYKTLTDAETKYAELEIEAGEEAAAQAKVNAVLKLIEDIGEVDKDNFEDALAKIEAAEKAYDELGDLKARVEEDDLKTLTDAREAYDTFVEEAKQEKADEVIELIDAIGEINEENAAEKEPLVIAARAAYDALKEDVKELVTNFETLVAAEKAVEATKEPTVENVPEISYNGTAVKLAVVTNVAEGNTVKIAGNDAVMYKDAKNAVKYVAVVDEDADIEDVVIVPGAAQALKLGDVTGDGVVNSADAYIIFWKAVESDTIADYYLNLINYIVSDLDGNGRITAGDSFFTIGVWFEDANILAQVKSVID